MKRLIPIANLFLGLAACPSVAKAELVLPSFFPSTPSASVSYDSSAPESNFGAPTAASDTVAYNIYLASDSTYIYGLVQVANGGTADLAFANIYVDTVYPNVTDGSNLGFEVTNDQAFIPGAAGYTSLAGTGFSDEVIPASGGVGTSIEFEIPWSFVLTDPLNMGFAHSTGQVQFRLSQSFGYSVAGGTANYGPNDLGVVTQAVPEPSTGAMAGLAALAGLVFAWRRRRGSA